MVLLTLDDVFAYDIDTALDELLEKLRLETQEEVLKVGEVCGIESDFGLVLVVTGEPTEVGW